MNDIHAHMHNCSELAAIDITDDGLAGVISFDLWSTPGADRRLVSIGMPVPALRGLRDALTLALASFERDQAARG